jgi:hypothetical protein
VPQRRNFGTATKSATKRATKRATKSAVPGKRGTKGAPAKRVTPSGQRADVATMSDAELEAYAIDVMASDDHDPGIVEGVDTEDLRRVAEAADQVREAERKLMETVELARARGWSWTRIGTALDVTRQAARQRFGSREAESVLGSLLRR